MRTSSSCTKHACRYLYCKLQVPKKLSAACCAAVEQGAFPGSLLAIDALIGLLHAAETSKVVAHLEGQPNTNSNSSTVACNISQQLQQSDFLQLLPGLFHKAIRQLQAAEPSLPPEVPQGQKHVLWCDLGADDDDVAALPTFAVQWFALKLMQLHQPLNVARIWLFRGSRR